MARISILLVNKKCICKIFPFSDNKYKHKHTGVNDGLTDGWQKASYFYLIL